MFTDADVCVKTNMGRTHSRSRERFPWERNAAGEGSRGSCSISPRSLEEGGGEQQHVGTEQRWARNAQALVALVSVLFYMLGIFHNKTSRVCK